MHARPDRKVGSPAGSPHSHLLNTTTPAVRLRSLLLRVMQAWERCAGTHTPQASSPIQYGNPGTVFTSIIPSIIIVGYVTSNISRNVTSSSLRVARALRLGGEGLVAPPLHLSVTRSDQIIFSALQMAANRLAATILAPDAAPIPPSSLHSAPPTPWAREPGCRVRSQRRQGLPTSSFPTWYPTTRRGLGKYPSATMGTPPQHLTKQRRRSKR